MKKVTFSIPDGYAVPEGIKSGDEFDASVTMKLEDGGKKLCILKVDGIALPGYDDEGRKAQEGEATAATDASFAQRYQAATEEPIA